MRTTNPVCFVRQQTGRLRHTLVRRLSPGLRNGYSITRYGWQLVNGWVAARTQHAPLMRI